MIRFSLLIAGMLVVSQLSAQTSDYIYQQFTVSDGLPSNECHVVFQDEIGYIWIGTDNGLVRYDGDTFKRYSIDEGLGESVVFQIIEDDARQLWVGGLSGKIYGYNIAKDRFELYSNQAKLDSLRYPGTNVMLLQEFSFSRGDLVLPLHSVGLCRIGSDGEVGILDSAPDNSVKISFVDADPPKPLTLLGRDGNSPLIPVYMDRNDNIHSVYVDTMIRSLPGLRPAYCHHDTIVTYSNGKLSIIKDSLVSRAAIVPAANINALESGSVVVALLAGGGVRKYSSLHSHNYESIISEVSATDFMVDSDNGWWITSLDKGLFYIKNPTIKYFGDSRQSVERMEVVDSLIVFVTADEYIYIGRRTGSVRKVYSDIDVVGFCQPPDGDGDILISHAGGTFILNPATSAIESRDSQQLKLLAYANSRTYEMSMVGTLSTIDFDRDRGIRCTMLGSSYHQVVYRPNCMVSFRDSALLIGGLEGLCMINPSKGSIRWVPQFAGIRVEDVIVKDSIVLLATKGQGLGIWSLTNDKVAFYRQSQGIIDDYLEDIYIDSRGYLWVSSLAGVSQVRLDRNRMITDILNYTVSHGLPVPDVYQVVEYNGQVIAATGAGLVTLPRRADNQFADSPLLSRVAVNGTTRDDISSLDHDETNITVELTTINYAHAGRERYRYRLDGAPWSVSDASSVAIYNLGSGDHNLSFQAENEDGIWSDTTALSFRIEAPWWQTWPFRLLLLFGIATIIYVIVHARQRRRKQKAAINQELLDLEKSALRAQMNPHFIFNCLNSIQRYIMSHDRELAMEYLAKFSRLIRKYLHASTVPTISINDEVTMLQMYLDLELVRFGPVFIYDIEVDEAIDTYTTQIPTMLVQPFVENAILHGMKGKQVGEGYISISMRLDDGGMVIRIADNGPGMSDKPSSPHNSLGRSITQRRIDLIQAGNEGDYLLKTDSSAEGTIVTITLP